MAPTMPMEIVMTSADQRRRRKILVRQGGSFYVIALFLKKHCGDWKPITLRKVLLWTDDHGRITH
jgi:hypothetical protein